MLITGQKEGKITIDFTILEEKDARGESMHIAGGRAYFEADVIGNQISSFTAKGFFDKLGYVEPPANNNSKLALILGLTIPLVTIAIITLVVLYCCWKKKQKKTLHVD